MYEYTAFVNRVIDGDTIDVTIDLGFDTKLNAKIRLMGINAPELKEEAGKAAKQALQLKIEGKEVRLLTIKDKKEKYGRYLANVIIDRHENVNFWLVENGYAVYATY